jgi:glycosyltransferase involved in cell wall biosynthesis
VVANGVDADEFLPRSVAPRSDGFTVGFVGSLKPWHGLADLIEAFSRLRQLAGDVRLLIVGDGPERNRLEEDLGARGLVDAVQFTGAVAHSEVPALLASMDAAVAPYPKLANFYFSPLKIFEYMAAGLPIVASRTGQVAQLIEDGVTGLLYEPGDIGAMFEALDRLRRDSQLRGDLGRAARAAILRGHTWRTIVERILRISRRNQASVTLNRSVPN